MDAKLKERLTVAIFLRFSFIEKKPEKN